MYILVYTGIYVYNYFLPDDLLRELVFFNTFEELNLPIKGPMEDAGHKRSVETRRQRKADRS